MKMRDLPALGPVILLVGVLASACAAPEKAQVAQRGMPQQASPAVAMLSAAAAKTSEMWNTTVFVKSPTGHGTGVIIAPGRILTAYHVANEGALEIEFFGGEQRPGTVSWANRDLDLAIITVPAPLRYHASALYCGALERDQKLIAIGHPLTSRWVSVEGSLRMENEFELGRLVPLSFDLSLGNSGGPVFDEAGRVVGIASAILIGDRLADIAAETGAGQDPGNTGVGLMLPASSFCAELSAI